MCVCLINHTAHEREKKMLSNLIKININELDSLNERARAQAIAQKNTDTHACGANQSFII